jgi:hypothetical protein
LNEIRFCYERELERTPGLYGRLVAAFSVGPTGRVVASALASSTLRSPRVEACVVQAVARWEFPRPGGVVTVNYPFVLRSSGE